MKLRIDQLASNLEQNGLAPIFLLSGDEPLQLAEAADAIRMFARRQGFDERVVLTVELGFDWMTLQQARDNRSLFSSRRLIELRMGEGKPKDGGAEALIAYAEAPLDDIVLLVTAGKLERKIQQSQWFKALDASGVVIQVWPVEARQLPNWIIRRTAGRGVNVTREAATLIAERVEGNLLAAAQELDKLLLLKSGETIEVGDVLGAVADSARFDVFSLVDAALEGDAGRSVRILMGLKGEGVEASLVLWALTRELRIMSVMSEKMYAGLQRVLAEFRVWERRRPLVKRALLRHGTCDWYALLREAAAIDRIVKGVVPGNAWDALKCLCLAIAGVKLGFTSL
ncbi:MAG: DNA polymerase III subunit delta [Gammaproteobacteria bacterium]|nr:DNA polymerase III subunit delta [Gammaproteobacteria bacterium]MCI0591456.1 DNA polymerase III subunit delta [Gammaproteobacteria bacterium]